MSSHACAMDHPFFLPKEEEKKLINKLQEKYNKPAAPPIPIDFDMLIADEETEVEATQILSEAIDTNDYISLEFVFDQPTPWSATCKECLWQKRVSAHDEVNAGITANVAHVKKHQELIRMFFPHKKKFYNFTPIDVNSEII